MKHYLFTLDKKKEKTPPQLTSGLKQVTLSSKIFQILCFIHMTPPRYGFLPDFILKQLTATSFVIKISAIFT